MDLTVGPLKVRRVNTLVPSGQVNGADAWMHQADRR